ncbi:Glycosyl transferase, family 2 [Sulfitobacter noctilucae]|uniref:glycosyltransferase family 2 protein n=1 Tax=Sulfitobacter noctilucae TaxID=1342302 RepID=UPI00046996BD|nr:glycosyltransferase [Sulfitobacter noctilucae]KIN65684.1 Glycosyl transferase, family 2 [Sulfitobacter noctilucae]
MTNLTVSVVVVSRGRADALKRCLFGLSQLQYPDFEIIIVADPDGIAAAKTLPFSADLKLVLFNLPNISAARNLGIVQAAGDIIAFIDDDAVPEPTWLRYLTAPALQSDVAAMGGYVRGRNGISYQWKARSIDRFGDSHPLDLDANRATVLHPPKGRAIKTEGTNMAFRRSVLIELGGFDPAFHYYLDETDLNVRLARAGYATALVPLAEVHHGFAANRMRGENRVPRDLYDIGASWAVFQRKHVIDAERVHHWKRLRASERIRLLKHMVSGGLEPHSVRYLLGRLDAGYAEGQLRPMPVSRLAQHPAEGFKPFPYRPRNSELITSRPWKFKADREAARERVKNGAILTLLSLSFTGMYHQVSFTQDGLWIQRGGLFGRSDRSGRLLRMTTRSRRVEKERRRVARQRGFIKD